MALLSVLNIKNFTYGASLPAIKKYIRQTFGVEIINKSALKRALSRSIFTKFGRRFKLTPLERARLRGKSSNKLSTFRSRPQKQKKGTDSKREAKQPKTTTVKAADKNKSTQDPGPKTKPTSTLKEEGLVHYHGVVYEANLAVVDISTNTDKFYKLQLVHAEDKTRLVQHWGRTGTAGQSKATLLPRDEGISTFEAVFKDKAGVPWAQRASYTAKTGKYSFLHKDYSYVQKGMVRWKYFIGDGVDGKANGWYDYAEEASAVVETTFQEWKMNKAWLTVRSIQSGTYSYHVDFSLKTQTNLSTQKQRQICRFVDNVISSY